MDDLQRISTTAELAEIVKEMKMSAVQRKYRESDQQPYAKTVEEANERCQDPEYRDSIKEIMGRTLVVVILMDERCTMQVAKEDGTHEVIKGFPITMSLSVEIHDDDREFWHLSISSPMMTEEGPSRVPDCFANPVVEAFFGQDGREFDAGSAYKHVRHFAADKKKPKQEEK